MSAQPLAVHLVGSVNLSTTTEVFEQIPTLLPNRLRRLPDGETGKRYYFTAWQTEVVAAVPGVAIDRNADGTFDTGPTSFSAAERDAALEKLGSLHTGYEDHALQSYAIFKEQKLAGNIPPDVHFQVSLPGIVNAVAGFRSDFQLHLEPKYEAALVRSLETIQREVPHQDLAIQIDVAIEIAFLTGSGPWPPYFTPVFEGVIDRVSRFANRVAPDVELGFHLCYGDVNHKHFIEPEDLQLLVDVANALHQRVNREIRWIHVPVPKGRKDAKYFAPLKNLEWEIPELYLGLVHANNEQGTKERIAVAQEVVHKFGVATECGLGRTPKEELASIMEISKIVSAPVT